MHGRSRMDIEPRIDIGGWSIVTNVSDTPGSATEEKNWTHVENTI